MLARQMAYEWGPDGIRVNCVSPGPTHSRSTEGAWDEAGIEYRASKLPMRRLAQPEDIANVVSFLSGPQGSYVTGENIHADGGIRFVTMEYMVPPDTQDKYNRQR